jgi:hypothetical protein
MFQEVKVTLECMLGFKRLCYIIAKMLVLNINSIYRLSISQLNFEVMHKNILYGILD